MEALLANMSKKCGYVNNAVSEKQPSEEKPCEEDLPIEKDAIWNPNVTAVVNYLPIHTGWKQNSMVGSPLLEIQRQKCVRSLQHKLTEYVQHMGITPLPNSAYECWQFCLKLNATKERMDPLISYGSFKDSEGLQNELKTAGASHRTSGKVVEKLLQAAKKVSQTLVRQNIGAGKKNVKVVHVENMVELKYQDMMVKCHARHFTKLQHLYGKHSVSLGVEAKAFSRYLFILLLRYESLQGGGFQAAINEECFDVMLQYFDCKMECFASPLNARYGTYCSAFPDTDVPFGSLGSFFDFKPTSGCFEANPPFVPELISKMTTHMSTLLTSTKQPLMFIIIIPEWKETEGWQTLKNSKFNQEYLAIAQAEHGYLEGKQHMRPTRWRVASFNTSVFFWQNPQAAAQYPITQEIVDALRLAFASKQEEERIDNGLTTSGRRVVKEKEESQDRKRQKTGKY